MPLEPNGSVLIQTRLKPFFDLYPIVLFQLLNYKTHATFELQHCSLKPGFWQERNGSEASSYEGTSEISITRYSSRYGMCVFYSAFSSALHSQHSLMVALKDKRREIIRAKKRYCICDILFILLSFDWMFIIFFFLFYVLFIDLIMFSI